jgi:arginine/serine-rich splicing factor 12
VTTEQLLSLFSQVGEVKYVRMAGDEVQPTNNAFVEFTDQRSISTALTYNGVMFQTLPIRYIITNFLSSDTLPDSLFSIKVYKLCMNQTQKKKKEKKDFVIYTFTVDLEISYQKMYEYNSIQ